ncbi:MAG TPA: pantoate--beta-alanine ligase [Bacteroidota bacterium]|nr:pantoate--beta-alanine ligase [Bacteroidota bacterium]
MVVIRSVFEMQREAERLRGPGRTIGLVPTMGYLHAGHESLIAEARRSCDVVVLSIFVNPTQFAPSEDFARYPRDFERDTAVAQKAGVDIVFAPESKEMYPDAYSTYVGEVEASGILEGQFRPTHFRGVTTVVAKLLNICKPHIAVFGQKDAQQAYIIGRMVRDLNIDVTIVVAPIVREPDGLAMSSRNVYLSAEDRRNATVLYESLKFAEREVRGGERSAATIRTAMETMIRSKGSPRIDYIAFLDPDKFREIDTLNGTAVLIALAVRFGNTRLIDNVVVTTK